MHAKVIDLIKGHTLKKIKSLLVSLELGFHKAFPILATHLVIYFICVGSKRHSLRLVLKFEKIFHVLYLFFSST